MAPRAGELILDIGGAARFWSSLKAAEEWRFVLLNIGEIQPPDDPNQFSCARGDGCVLPFGDNSFSLAFSNSVIEHVGTFQRQQEFAAEIRRVAPRFWVQTPARECPVEPHYLALFVHWLPASVQRRVLRWVSVWGWVQQPSADDIDCMVRETHLLSGKQFRALFPDCQVITERLFGVFPKSYIAIRGSA